MLLCCLVWQLNFELDTVWFLLRPPYIYLLFDLIDLLAMTLLFLCNVTLKKGTMFGGKMFPLPIRLIFRNNFRAMSDERSFRTTKKNTYPADLRES